MPAIPAGHPETLGHLHRSWLQVPWAPGDTQDRRQPAKDGGPTLAQPLLSLTELSWRETGDRHGSGRDQAGCRESELTPQTQARSPTGHTSCGHNWTSRVDTQWEVLGSEASVGTDCSQGPAPCLPWSPCESPHDMHLTLDPGGRRTSEAPLGLHGKTLKDTV